MTPHPFGMKHAPDRRARLARVPHAPTPSARRSVPRAVGGEWSGLFWSAFRKSRNAMALVDHDRALVDVNAAFVRLVGRRRDEVLGRALADYVVGGQRFSPAEWRAALASGQFTGDAELVHADGTAVAVQWDASTEVVTGRHLVLFVALSTSRWGGRFRRMQPSEQASGGLTMREREVVSLVAMGATGPEIAEELHIAHDTVRTHVRNAMTRLGARSRAHLVARALAGGHVFG
jgi:PAS domain S-box-containing protein